MRVVFVISFLANLALTVVSVVVLPDRIATHFGAGGMADGWGSKGANALVMGALCSLMFGLFYLSPRLVLMVPPRWVNLPHKQYWLRPENKARAAALLATCMWRFGTAMNVFLFALGVLTIEANLSQPVQLDMRRFTPLLILFLVYTGWWCIGMFRVFRVPQEHPEAD